MSSLPSDVEESSENEIRLNFVQRLSREHESLYSRCLFKTISFHELKTELVKRSIEVSGDTFYIMTLKLRLDILGKENCDVAAQDDLRTEILVAKKDCGKGYFTCSVPGCSYSKSNYRSLLTHLNLVHPNNRHPIVCQYNGCPRVLSSMTMFNLHIKTCHQPRRSSVALKQNQLCEEYEVIQCQNVSCGHQKFKRVKDLKVHLVKNHIEMHQEVECIFEGCVFKTNVGGTLASHFSRNHKLQQVSNLKPEVLGAPTNYQNMELDDSFRETTYSIVGEREHEQHIPTNAPEEGFDLVQEANTISNDDASEEDDQILFTKALAIQFNTWCNVKMVPYSTVSEIVKEVFLGYERGMSAKNKSVEKILLKGGIADNVVRNILEDIDLSDPFKLARDELGRDSDRQKFVMEEFNFVKPISVCLNPVDLDGKKHTMQYVPIKQSLKALLENESYIKQKITDPYIAENNVIKDCKDGRIFQENKFFIDNPTAVPILLFQDELEVVNPLGAGKGKHKIQCTYYTTLDITPALRSKVKSIQLVSLVLSKDWKQYGNLACNANLLEDLKDLEENGLQIYKPVERIVKAGLALIVGDNLGQHMLSEMNCSFSSGYICRVCDAKYDDVCLNGLLYSGINDDYQTTYITKDKYDECANLSIEIGRPSPESLGIKGHCVFNSLKSFHCIDQCAPCVGHDYFEGVFAYDVQHYLDFIIIKEKLISVEDFNKKLEKLKLSRRDAYNRPKKFKKGAKKYEGNAGSLRILSRYLTLILAPLLDTSLTGKYLIKLHELGEIITAPVLTYHDIWETMARIIREYLDLRVEAIECLGMCKARPKHHYLSHYPRAYMNAGPLINVWGMRMESKHTYFKGVIRVAKNFKNVPLTCATRHQLSQISHHFNGLFPMVKVIIPDNAPTLDEISPSLAPNLQQFLTSHDPSSLVPKFVTVYGTRYDVGEVLVLEVLDEGLFEVGVIKCILLVENQVCFCVSVFEASLSKYGYYVTTKFLSLLKSVRLIDIADYYPLKPIGNINAFSFALHHFISRRT